MLADAASGALVEGGRNIPLDQILAGPQRANPILTFETEDEVRGVSQMLLDQTGVGEATLRSGHHAGRRKGWGPLSYGCFVAFQTVPQGPKSRELTVGKVLENRRDDQQVVVHQYRGLWKQVRVVHVPAFLGANGEVLDPRAAVRGSAPSQVTVLYAALVLQVELQAGGELTYTSASTLSKRCLLYTSPSPRD